MVYCGKPSKGCSNCRERKIRCDQREPGCGQCEKRQQQCPGYRNLVDLMFRDESSHVIKKANAKARRGNVPSTSKPTPSPNEPTHQSTGLAGSSSAMTSKVNLQRRPRECSSSSSSTDPVSDSHPSALTATFHLSSAGRPKVGQNKSKEFKHEPETSAISALVPCRYSPSFEDRGLNLFITRYISIPANSCQNKFDFVFDFWTPATSPSARANDPVLASLSAVGLLGLAQIASTQTALNAARKSYGRALRLTNAALRDPVEALKDKTMLCVLVLSIYETMSDHPGRRSMAAWQQHINGASALARTRGPAQFRSKAGIRMFMMQVSSTMISCIENELPMPHDLIELRKKLMEMLGGAKNAPGWEVCTPIYKILQLKYDIKQGRVNDLDEMLNTFNEADDDFETAISLFPESWNYEKFKLTTDRHRPGFFSTVCHIYPNIHIATIWNGTRTCRMLILETLCEELNKRFSRVPMASVPARYQLEYQKARFKLKSIGLSILATVPQHFEKLSPSDDDLDKIALVSSAEEIWSATTESDLEEPLGENQNQSCSDKERYRHPSLSNPMQAHGEARAERYMLLTSVTNSLVWPLYLVGMSTASSAAMRTFVVERLHAIFEESGLPQARQLADAVTKHSQFMAAPERSEPLR